METKNKKRLIFAIVLSCWLAYTFSICMKMVYSASMVAIKDEYGVPHSIASLPITLYYIFYAVIQLFLALIMKKINMKLYMLITFSISGLSFISIFFFSPIWYVCSVMAINGITLGAVWCGTVMILSKYLTKKQMDDSLLFMGAGSVVGNTLSYGISALSMHTGNWRLSILIMGTAFLLSAIYLIISTVRAERAGLVPEENSADVTKKQQIYTVEKYEAKPLVAMAIIIVFFACILYYAFTNWMPTILKSVFGIDNIQATLITTIFPFAVFAGVYLAHVVSNSMKNDFLLTFLCGATVTVLSLILCFTYNLNIVICVAIIVGLGIVLRLVNALNCSMVTLHTRDYFNSGTTASVINSSACLAAGISPALIAMVLDLSGGDWKTGFFVLLITAIAMTVVALAFLLVNIRRRAESRDLKIGS